MVHISLFVETHYQSNHALMISINNKQTKEGDPHGSQVPHSIENEEEKRSAIVYL
jgi:hypothetical protein